MHFARAPSPTGPLARSYRRIRRTSPSSTAACSAAPRPTMPAGQTTSWTERPPLSPPRPRAGVLEQVHRVGNDRQDIAGRRRSGQEVVPAVRVFCQARLSYGHGSHGGKSMSWTPGEVSSANCRCPPPSPARSAVHNLRYLPGPDSRPRSGAGKCSKASDTGHDVPDADSDRARLPGTAPAPRLGTFRTKG
jgi:hypothetical protein